VESVSIRIFDFQLSIALTTVITPNHMTTVYLRGRLIEIIIGDLDIYGYSRIGAIQERMVGPSLDERKAGQESYERAAGILEALHAARPGDAAVAAELTDVYAGLLEIDMRSGRSEKGAERAARAIAVGERALAGNAGHTELTRRLANAYVLYNRDVAGRAEVAPARGVLSGRNAVSLGR